jgi:FKBP-type peptidyl-prolyl cis-trans isomerase FklB
MKMNTIVWLTLGLAASAITRAEDKANLKTQQDKVSYTIGNNIGKNFKQQGIQVNFDFFLKGVKDGAAGTDNPLTEEEVRDVMAAFQKEMQSKEEQKGSMNKQTGEKFLADNKKKPGVVSLPSGLQYKVVKEGTGPIPKDGETVETHYRGTLLDGTEFDSSYKRKETAVFGVNDVIKGWTEALKLMKVGSKWQLFIPSDLAYGDRGAGGQIGPNSTLLFDIELISIKPKEVEKK